MTRYDNLAKLVKQYKCTTIMEIGVYNAIHACEMIKAAQTNTDNLDDVFYYGFDLFEDFWLQGLEEKEFCPKKPITRADTEKRLIKTECLYNLIQGNTHDTLWEFKPTRLIDFIHVDGGHSKETLWSDWSNIQTILSRQKEHDCKIVFDDYYPREQDKNAGCAFIIDDLEDSHDWKVTKLLPIDIVNEDGLQVCMVLVEKI